MLLYDMNPLVSFLRTFDTHLVDSISDRARHGIALQPRARRDYRARAEGRRRAGPRQVPETLREGRALLPRHVREPCGAHFRRLRVDPHRGQLLPAAVAAPRMQEKFAMLLHFVAVCVSASSPVSSWIGLRVGSVSTATAGTRPQARSSRTRSS